MAHVVVVEDEKRVALIIERVLSSEHTVRIAHNAVDGLRLARRIQPNLFILDWTMPGMDGLELCQQIQTDALLKSIPILFVTARAQADERVAGLKAGAQDYLTKPFDIRELRLRANNLIARAADPRQVGDGMDGENPPPRNLLAVGDLVLDCSRYRVSTAGQASVDLTPVEYQLLYHLMCHPGKVYSAEDLLRELWDFPSDAGSPDLVRVHIKNLRHKIEPDRTQPCYLITIPRHGYMISTV
jgi:two-component system alkaline phosphatase synthesis response regulator PhoP/two-component system response regulator RpaA